MKKVGIFVVGFLVLLLTASLQGQAQTKPLEPGVFHLDDLFKKGLDTKGPDNRGAYSISVLAQNEKGAVRIWDISSVKAHRHPEGTHYVYILEQRFKIRLGDKDMEIGPGDLVVIPPTVLHRFEVIGNKPGKLIDFVAPPPVGAETVWEEP